ncbi:hypothetical protein FB567DRAFT_529225 [Paraphoma chrysanthemicola]|uniref:Uncharacterized protein n=1 Tax=Paraphoma chrysanthemicola TaxID=798071 RepID=A0A8K0VWY2_9PLEO|nr:hypothetical protein FB567DRAFT_529225 [Paraphoma chrysanthemicola]
MDYLIARALPTVLLSSFSTPHASILVTESFSKQHEKLISLTYHRFSNDYPKSDWDVHFHHDCAHIMNGRCEAEIDDFLYDEGEYFTERYMHEGKLRLYAHFVAKGPRSLAQWAPEPLIMPMLPREDLGDWLGSSAQNAIKIDSSPRPNKRVFPDVIDHFDCYSEYLPSHDFTFQLPMTSITTTVKGPSVAMRPRPSAEYTSLPMGATALQFLIDHESMVSKGPPDDSRHYRRDYALCNTAKKRGIAHALLMDGDFYGVEASQPCVSCVKRGEKCRIYHPDMHVLPWKADLIDVNKRGVGAQCAMCRAKGRTSSATGACCAA